MTKLDDFNSRIFSVIILLSGFLGSICTNGETLDCFSCSNITDINDCHTIKTCSQSQSCFTESYVVNGRKTFTLGCKESVFCLGIDKTHMFGRRESGCTQCCSLHGCNKYLCPVRFTASPPPVDGKWSTWGSWAGCSSSCGIGLQSRYRKCDNPPPSTNGRLCLGDAKDVGLCYVNCSTTAVPLITTTSPIVTSTPYYDGNKSTQINYVTNNETQMPGQCKDLINCTGYYRPDACHGIYSPWAHRYCPVHCGFCPTAPTIPCEDTIYNCHEYQSDVCTNQAFWQWRESHCRKFCNLC